jgi:hypothetical protein
MRTPAAEAGLPSEVVEQLDTGFTTLRGHMYAPFPTEESYIT